MLVDLLEHVVGEAPLLGGLEGPVHLHHFPFQKAALQVRDLHPFPGDPGQVPVVEEDDPPGVGQKGGYVRARKFSPSPRPMTKGLTVRAATISSRSSWTTTTA